ERRDGEYQPEAGPVPERLAQGREVTSKRRPLGRVVRATLPRVAGGEAHGGDELAERAARHQVEEHDYLRHEEAGQRPDHTAEPRHEVRPALCGRHLDEW